MRTPTTPPDTPTPPVTAPIDPAADGRAARRNLRQRIATGVAGIALMIGAILYSEWTYLGLFGGLVLACQWEFYRLLFRDGQAPLRYLGSAIGLVLYAMLYLTWRGLAPGTVLLLLPPMMALVYFVKLYKRGETKPFTNVGFTFLGIMYTALPLSLMHVLAFPNGGGAGVAFDPRLVIGALVLLWASDSGAYFAGTRFGRHQLFARVSPKKSWEGTLGGLATSTLTAFALHLSHPTGPGLLKWLLMMAVIVVAGTYGDLVESLFKRSILIKDSGSSLPGHGGFLDRFDGLLLSMPFLAALEALWPLVSPWLTTTP